MSVLSVPAPVVVSSAASVPVVSEKVGETDVVVVVSVVVAVVVVARFTVVVAGAVVVVPRLSQ